MSKNSVLGVLLCGAMFVANAHAAATPSTALTPEAKALVKTGTAHFNAKEYDAAVADYEQAYALSRLPKLLFNLAQSYRLAGNKVRALDFYRGYIDALPEGRGADEALRHIDELARAIAVEDAEHKKEMEKQLVDAQAALEAAVDTPAPPPVQLPAPPPKIITVEAKPNRQRQIAYGLIGAGVIVAVAGGGVLGAGFASYDTDTGMNGCADQTVTPHKANCSQSESSKVLGLRNAGIGLLAVGGAAIVTGTVWAIIDWNRSGHSSQHARNFLRPTGGSLVGFSF